MVGDKLSLLLEPLEGLAVESELGAASTALGALDVSTDGLILTVALPRTVGALVVPDVGAESSVPIIEGCRDTVGCEVDVERGDTLPLPLPITVGDALTPARGLELGTASTALGALVTLPVTLGLPPAVGREVVTDTGAALPVTLPLPLTVGAVLTPSEG